MSISIIHHKGVDIFFTNLSGKSAKEAMKVIEEANQKIRTLPKKSVRTLLNVKGMRYSTEYLEQMKAAGKHNEPFVIATAVYGLSAITKMIGKGVAQFTGRKTEFFDSKEEAMDWLSEQMA